MIQSKATIPEVDEMVSIIDDTLDTLYRRGFYESCDGVGNQLEEGQWDRLKVALETAKKVSELVHLMEENMLSSNPSETPNSSMILLREIKSVVDEKREGAGKYQSCVMDIRLILHRHKAHFAESRVVES